MSLCDQTSNAPPSRQACRFRVLALIILLLLLRIPLIAHPVPVHIDEQNFMLALGFPVQYPVHHPGYPLWVAMGTALHAVGLGPYSCYQAWSLAASLLGPLLFYLGLRRLLDDGLAWWLAFAFGVNPLVWFQATTALTYLSAATIGLVVVWLCYHAIAEQKASLASCAAATLAVGTFLRADLLIYLGPIVAYAALRSFRRGGWLTLLTLAIGSAALFALTSFLYGRGGPTLFRPSLSHTLHVIHGTSVFHLGLIDGLLRNAVKIALNIAWDFGVATPLLAWAAWGVARHRPAREGLGTTLILWTAPLFVFLLSMHVVQGYFMLLLPAGYLAIGLALQHKFSSQRAVRVAAAIAVCSFVQFTVYPWSADSTGAKRLLDAKIAFQSASGLRQIDRHAEIHQPGDFWPTAAHDLATAQPTTAPQR